MVYLAITGPTGVGKSALALDLAAHLGAEIVSADSRQVYRGLDVGTAKPSPEERARIPHHFVDEKALGEPFSAGQFADEANARISGLLARGGVPVAVGGSTLYFDALIHGLSEVPKADLALRRMLNAEVEAGETLALFDELRRVDPATAATLDVTKTQRLVRAVEVFRQTGRPLSSFQANEPAPPYPWHVVVLTRGREELYRRIEARVDVMLANGLVEENRRLLTEGHRLDTNPLRTIGYQEPLAYLSGEIDYDEMVRLLKRNTRRYAKRQLTWFRRRPEYVWVDLDTEPDPAGAILRSLPAL